MIVVIIICIMFSFVFAKKEYTKFCHKCHVKLFDICKKKAIKQIARKDVENQYILLVDTQ